MSLSYASENAESENSKLTAKVLEEHALFWVKQLPQLNTDERALLSNYFYFESLMSTYECAARHALITIHTASTRINKQLMSNESEAKTIALNTASMLQELTTDFLPGRSYALKASQACLNAIEKSDFTTLKKVIVNYQQYTRAVLAQFVKQDKPAIETIIKNAQSSLEANLKKMNECDQTFQLILNNKNPYVKEGMDADMVDLDVALAAGDACLSCMNEMMLTCVGIRSMSVDLLNISVLINKLFYHTLYQATQDHGTIYSMFDEHGFIEEDERDEILPAFDTQKIVIHKKHLTA